MAGIAVDERDYASGDASRPSGAEAKWTPRVEGEEGDPTAFDYVFGGAVVAVVIAAIMWAVGIIAF